MVSPEFVDPYLIPGTNVLRNLVRATSVEQLASAEADLSFARALQLMDSPIPASNDLTELKRIHRHLFQDVFEWAGQQRTVNVRKDVPGAEFFLPWNFIDRAAANCFAELEADAFLSGLPRSPFVERLAYHYEKINTGGSALFREGLLVS